MATVSVAPMAGRARFIAAARRQPVDATPVWFMRQAGRALPEYRALREKHDFMTVATTPELAVEATVMPVDRLGVDGAVLFADIMLPLTGMGVPFRIEPNVGPVIDRPVRDEAGIAALTVVEAEEGTPYVMEAVRLLRGVLGERAAVLGFSGAPFTLACYLVEGRSSREYPKTKALMYGRPDLWHRLMATLTEVVTRYLRAQIRAGADAVQLFDSWLGLLGPDAYEAFVLPYTRRIFADLAGSAPTIHFSTGTVSLLDQIASAGSDLVSVDWRLPLDVAWERIGLERGIQGNLDPTLLMATPQAVATGVADVLRRADGRVGHVFNLGHGILPETPPERLAEVVEQVHRDTATR
ncbi:MAG: Uroporphyrinogen III decarboxylase [uncultured Thermomicrobiales bacterium]|uniref:Uroporphyrinogen decarboxylase n=1 Tax=uncultured Thermomicrobiales bacterium TaxID=1645740 RepID=A0A6J4UHC4_9BACT|nr:MAG: Uroporphyrinogen III decarboxylase [uncultured Thermomicrobiales bacterium]